VKGRFWSVSLYTEKSNIDCAALAKKLGYEGPLKSGGGHRQASGFQTDQEHLFSYITTEEEEKK
jgi:nanoRNase/pAp phosphatase (c-di-AMP/oligoRNAs hydrolase)